MDTGPLRPNPSHWEALVDEFNQANDLLPPTHPNGPRRLQKVNPDIRVPVSDEMRFRMEQQAAAMRPMPPTERGWVPTTGTPIQDAIRTRQEQYLISAFQIALSARPETRRGWESPRTVDLVGKWRPFGREAQQDQAADRTFENETRLQ